MAREREKTAHAREEDFGSASLRGVLGVSLAALYHDVADGSCEVVAYSLDRDERCFFFYYRRPEWVRGELLMTRLTDDYVDGIGRIE